MSAMSERAAETRLTPAEKRVAAYLKARKFMGVESNFIDDQECGASDGDPVAELFANDLADVLAALTEARREVSELREGLINTPETEDFMRGVPLEALHQVERWGADHDVGKEPLDWFWLIGYLAQKAATSAMAGDLTKAKHHTISTAAALANWHTQLSGKPTAMRPGVDADERGFSLLQRGEQPGQTAPATAALACEKCGGTGMLSFGNGQYEECDCAN